MNLPHEQQDMKLIGPRSDECGKVPTNLRPQMNISSCAAGQPAFSLELFADFRQPACARCPAKPCAHPSSRIRACGAARLNMASSSVLLLSANLLLLLSPARALQSGLQSSLELDAERGEVNGLQLTRSCIPVYCPPWPCNKAGQIFE